MEPRLPQAWLEHDARVRPYVSAHRKVSSVRLAIAVIGVWWALQTRQIHTLESFLSAWGSTGLGLYLWFFGFWAAVWEVVTFPLSAAHYFIDRNYGLSKQTFGGWLMDHAKGLALGVALGLIAGTFTWYASTHWGDWWWAALAGFFVFFTVVLAQLAPVLLLPLFFKLTPLPDGELRDRLLSLSARFGVNVKEVFLLGLGAKTEKGNAAFMGLGKTKRIAIGDTIYGKYPPNQVLAVFGHELGHMVHQDIWKGLGFSTVRLFVTFALAHWLCSGWLWPKWFTWLETPTGLFLFFVVVALIGAPLGVLENMFSRWRERRADRFAAERVEMGESLADALEALTFQNQALFKPHPVREFFSYSHPAPWRRIVRLRAGTESST